MDLNWGAYYTTLYETKMYVFLKSLLGSYIKRALEKKEVSIFNNVTLFSIFLHFCGGGRGKNRVANFVAISTYCLILKLISGFEVFIHPDGCKRLLGKGANNRTQREERLLRTSSGPVVSVQLKGKDIVLRQ